MQKKIQELTEFAADHKIMIQNMNKRLKLVENVGAIVTIVSITSLLGLIAVLINIGLN